MRSLRRFSPNVHSLIAAALALCIVLLLAACAACDAQRLDEPVVHVVAMPTLPATTTTESPSTTALPPKRASRSRPIAATTAPGPTSPDAAFWRRLADCESPSGRSGMYLGYFQFHRGNARAVGWYDGASYDAQVAMAQRWLTMIGGPSRGGTRSGWPVCWWRALR